jgi:hypothetical protein
VTGRSGQVGGGQHVSLVGSHVGPDASEERGIGHPDAAFGIGAVEYPFERQTLGPWDRPSSIGRSSPTSTGSSFTPWRRMVAAYAGAAERVTR